MYSKKKFQSKKQQENKPEQLQQDSLRGGEILYMAQMWIP